MIKAFTLAVAGLLWSTNAIACSVGPSYDGRIHFMQTLFDEANYVFLGQVKQITYRARGERDRVSKRIVPERKQVARSLRLEPEDADAFVNAAEAFAHVEVILSLNDDGLDDTRQLLRNILKIDLLRPILAAGSCYGLPLTCPWTLEPDRWVLIAVNINAPSEIVTLYCKQLDNAVWSKALKELGGLQGIFENVGMKTPSELAWPFLEIPPAPPAFTPQKGPDVPLTTDADDNN